MSKVFIKADGNTSIISADKLITEDGYLYAYQATDTGGDLMGMYRLDLVEQAYITKRDGG